MTANVSHSQILAIQVLLEGTLHSSRVYWYFEFADLVVVVDIDVRAALLELPK